MSLETASAGSIARCGNSSANFEDFPGLPFSARCLGRLAARINPWLNSLASSRSTARALPSCWRRCASILSRSLLSISALSGPSISRIDFWDAGGIADTFKYQQRRGTTDEGIPYIVEFAFGLHKSGLEQGSDRVVRTIVTGANWSVGINNPFRAFGSTGEGLESTLSKVRANHGQPVICALHLASAHIQYADRGKSSIILTDDASQPDD